jgi:hypothetical protein
MAQRRMFSPQIIDSDAFLDMPPSAQNLYFHFSMRADDDGFVGNPKKIMRMLGAMEDDFKVLIAKRFVLTFESEVIVIKHWLIHNLIRADLYVETLHKKEKRLIGLNENGAYTELREGVSPLKKIKPPKWLRLRQKQSLTLRTANVPTSARRLGKDRLGKDNINPVANATPFDSKTYIQTLKTDNQEQIRIIGDYWEFKEFDFPNLKTAQNSIKRDLRPAVALVGYPQEKRIKTMSYLETLKRNKKLNKWTLETVGKYINEL